MLFFPLRLDSSRNVEFLDERNNVLSGIFPSIFIIISKTVIIFFLLRAIYNKIKDIKYSEIENKFEN